MKDNELDRTLSFLEELLKEIKEDPTTLLSVDVLLQHLEEPNFLEKGYVTLMNTPLKKTISISILVE
jgi:hypothetical protein